MFFNDVKGLLLPVWLLAAGAAAAQAGILIGGSFWRAAFRDSLRALGELGELGGLETFFGLCLSGRRRVISRGRMASGWRTSNVQKALSAPRRRKLS